MPRLTHDNANSSSIDDLQAVLAEQHEVTNALASLMDRQRGLVESGDAEGLLALLCTRQELVDRLIASQERLAEALAGAERALPGAGKEQKGRIEAALSGIAAQLAAVMERDRADQETLKLGSKQTRDDMGRIDVMHKAHAAYGRGAGKASRFADHRG